MTEQRCACNHCSCTVDANAILQDDKAYCCEACATGHRNGEPCRMADCNCAEMVQPKETNVDNALDETFPASDPISP
ncbi:MULTISPECIES: metallothionein [Pseudomonas]|uniref:Metallothionein n=2 Tax=Pseudomonas TaxID=286 RepID=A0AAX0VU00_9PSED|nr:MULTISPECIES: metallothionein [Pseudomonas]MBH3358262.1 metallothionein [Pseudomonas guariconensis]MCO7622036.1 metallothionein [Pseudomonas guariconensis]MDD2089882.1 metallothionein [Pseudomonas guariconensis]MDM9594160.1 metallothionein [Pseudomonas guariconensis]MDM9606987.1 metallothionein [Pseudomonas guariconensis]